jgi:hypothetical protein
LNVGPWVATTPERSLLCGKLSNSAVMVTRKRRYHTITHRQQLESRDGPRLRRRCNRAGELELFSIVGMARQLANNGKPVTTAAGLFRHVWAWCDVAKFRQARSKLFSFVFWMLDKLPSFFCLAYLSLKF